MIFLIVYDRQKGQKIIYEKFKDSEREKAEKRRQELEIDLNQKKETYELVLLEAARGSLFQHTHRRYLESLNAILKSTGQ